MNPRLSERRWLSHLPFGVLFLIDSKFAARTIVERTQFGGHTEPFNPYELQEKVGPLLVRCSAGGPRANKNLLLKSEETLASYLDYS
jgi:hypothetical protein